MTDPRFPIGRLEMPGRLTETQRAEAIQAIADLPSALHEAALGLGDSQLDTPYRDGGWSVRQVVHHVADSHVNAYVRMKLTLTEDEPTIRAYDEKAWAELPDSKLPPLASLRIVESVHERWTAMLRALPAASFERKLMHPEGGQMTFDDLVATYAWHGAHHAAHITTLRAAKGW